MINEHKVPVHQAYRLSSYSAASHFGLKRLGLIAPGKRADIVLLNDLKSVDIKEVMIAGQLVSELGLETKVAQKLEASTPPTQNTIKRAALAQGDIKFDLDQGTYNVIGIVKDEIITEHLKLHFDGQKFEREDVNFISVIERYGVGHNPALGLVHGSGLREGAIASSVAHDSHNIIVIGKSEDDMVLAANKLIEMGGGFCVVSEGKVVASLALPIAGLLSLKDASEINMGIIALKKACAKVGITLSEPFIQMAFLALPVIPSLKITDQGLVDVSRFAFTTLKMDGLEN